MIPVIAKKDDTKTPSKPAMTLGFELPDGTVQSVVFNERPLGMRFTASVPLTVTDVCQTGKAFDLGVQNGWKLRSIDGEDMVGQASEIVICSFCKKASYLPLVYL